MEILGRVADSKQMWLMECMKLLIVSVFSGSEARSSPGNKNPGRGCEV